MARTHRGVQVFRVTSEVSHESHKNKGPILNGDGYIITGIQEEKQSIDTMFQLLHSRHLFKMTTFNIDTNLATSLTRKGSFPSVLTTVLQYRSSI
jgi:hypothetical protein